MITVGRTLIGGRNPLVLFAGPCIVERRDLVLRSAEKIRIDCHKHSTPVIFKSSYKKANRTSGKSFTGIGMDESLKILAEVKREFDLPIITDVHTEQEAAIAAEVADILQIPAFLSRQTD